MKENQQYVNNLLDHDNFIDVETDTAYNNTPQAGGESAAQSFTPLVNQN